MPNLPLAMSYAVTRWLRSWPGILGDAETLLAAWCIPLATAGVWVMLFGGGLGLDGTLALFVFGCLFGAVALRSRFASQRDEFTHGWGELAVFALFGSSLQVFLLPLSRGAGGGAEVASSGGSLVFLALVLFVAPRIEELVFRRWLWGLHRWAPVAGVLLFAGIHLPMGWVDGLLMVPVGAALAISRHVTGGIACGTALHVGFNASGVMAVWLAA